MAALPISAPGTVHGPCLDEDCGHTDCAASRAAAACECRLCGLPIGYDEPCFDEWSQQPAEAQQQLGRYGFFVHESCAYEEAEELRVTRMGAQRGEIQ